MEVVSPGRAILLDPPHYTGTLTYPERNAYIEISSLTEKKRETEALLHKI